jgi:hypothetical protein
MHSTKAGWLMYDNMDIGEESRIIGRITGQVRVELGRQDVIATNTGLS